MKWLKRKIKQLTCKHEWEVAKIVNLPFFTEYIYETCFLCFKKRSYYKNPMGKFK